MGLFTDKKEMKKWAIALGNACGGAKVTTELQLTKVNPDQVVKLTQQFVNEYNAQMMKAIKKFEGGESE